MKYSLSDFAFEFRALLRKAVDNDLKVNDFCRVAKGILETGWEASAEGIEGEQDEEEIRSEEEIRGS